MITIIRRSFQSKIYKVILWITIFALAGIFSLPEILKFGSRQAWIARVNNNDVSLSEYVQKATAYQEYMEALRAQYGQAADIFLQQMGMGANAKTYAMDQVIQDALLDQVAAKLGFVIGSDFVEEKLANPLFVREELADMIPLGAFDQNGMVNIPLLKSYFQRIGLSMGDFQKRVEQKLKRRMVLQLAGLTQHVCDFEVKEQFDLLFAPKKYSLLKLPLSQFIAQAKKTAISDQELKEFFDAQNAASQRYWVDQKRGATVWRIAPSDYGITISDGDIENYYEDNKVKLFAKDPAQVQVRHIFLKVPTEIDRQITFVRAQDIRAQAAANPSKFAQLAEQSSDDAATKKNGGLVPYFARGQKEAAFDKAAFILKENGDISEVIFTQDGFEIIQRVDKKMATYKPLASVKKEISDLLLKEKFAQLFARDVKKIAASENKNAIADLMNQKKAHKQSIKDISRNDAQWGNSLFGLHEKLDIDLFMDKGEGYVVQLTDIDARYLPELAAVKDLVSQDIYQMRAEQKLNQVLKDARQQAATKSLSELHQTFGGELQKTDWVLQSDKQAPAKLREKGFPVDQLFQLEKIGSIASSQADKDGYIVRLDEIKAADQNEFKAKKADLIKELEQEKARLMRASFVALLYRSAKIETNESVANLNIQE